MCIVSKFPELKRTSAQQSTHPSRSPHRTNDRRAPPLLPGPAAGDPEEQQGTDGDEFPAHSALCRDDTLPVTRSVKLQTSGAVSVSVSRKARSSSVSGGAPYVYFHHHGSAPLFAAAASVCLCSDDGDGGAATTGFWSRVVPVITTRLRLLISSFSSGSSALKEKDFFQVSTRAAMAGITSFSTCTDASTWFTHTDYIISQ